MSGQKTDITMQDVLRGAFAALLDGDIATRDKLCKVAEAAFEGRGSVPQDMKIKDEHLALAVEPAKADLLPGARRAK